MSQIMESKVDVKNQLVDLDNALPLEIDALGICRLVSKEVAEVYKFLSTRVSGSSDAAFHLAMSNFQSISVELSARVYLFEVLTSFSASNVYMCGRGGVGLIGSVVRRVYAKCQSRQRPPSLLPA